MRKPSRLSCCPTWVLGGKREEAIGIGVSVHCMDEELNAGDVFDSTTTSIYVNDRVLDAQNRALELGRLEY